MRRSALLGLTALALLVAPAATSATAAGAVPAPAPATASAPQAGSSALATRTRRPTVVRTAKRVTRPAAKPTPKAAPRPALTPAATPAVKPAATPALTPVAQPARSGAYAFLNVEAGAPTRWNPCADVPWVFNPAGAPAGGLSAVQAAIAELGSRTGLRFAYLGTSTDVPTAGYLAQSWKQFRPLLVGWTTAGESDLLAGRSAGTVGMARILWTGSYDSTGANRTQIASGVVALNRASSAPTTGAGSWYTYALHELGHAVGLAHVDDSTQVMNAVIGRSVTGYGAGDLAGLAKVGKGAGCLPAIR